MSDVCVCVALNECAYDNGGCDQICNNTAESFVCSCEAGFQLQANGRTCVPIGQKTALLFLLLVNYSLYYKIRQSTPLRLFTRATLCLDCG